MQNNANTGITVKPRGKIKDKRSAILKSALHELSQQGFHETNMRKIADRAEIAVGTIYMYFKNKEELLHALYAQISKEVNELIEENLSSSLPLKKNFITVWSALLKHYIERPDHTDFILSYMNSSYVKNYDLSEEEEQILSPIYPVLTNAVENNLIKNLSIPALIALTHGPIMSLALMNRYDNVDMKDLDIDLYANACWHAIRNSDI